VRIERTFEPFLEPVLPPLDTVLGALDLRKAGKPVGLNKEPRTPNELRSVRNTYRLRKDRSPLGGNAVTPRTYLSFLAVFAYLFPAQRKADLCCHDARLNES
jgi:hypothetical protein